MATTTPSAVRGGLLTLTRAARADLRTVVRAARQDPQEARAALFAAAPLVVREYNAGAGVLALDWYAELREAAGVETRFQLEPFVAITDDEVAAMVARTTESLYEIQRGIEREIEEAFAESLANIEAETTQIIADAFRETVVENANQDPASVGWRRFARPEACKFCLMLAARGAVYTKETARFAAHGAFTNGKRTGGDCMCIAGPAFGGQEIWAEATPMQYVASKRKRTAKERAALRAYLNKNYPDAPG